MTVSTEKRPNPTSALRAGDTVSYTVSLENTGDGDWNQPSNWATGNPLALSMDLSDVLDDAAVTRSPTGGAAIAQAELRWSGGLAAGHTHRIEFDVRVANQSAGSGSNLMLRAEAVATGGHPKPGRSALGPDPIGRD